MNRAIAAALVTGLYSTGVFAGGLDRSGQPIGILFEEGNYAEVSLAFVDPSVSGVDTFASPGTPYSDVANSFTQLGGGIKFQFNDQVSFALIADQPFGSDITYPGAGATTSLGGTSAIADSVSLTALGRYEFTDRFSVHGGVRYQRINGDITLSGLAYGPAGPPTLNSYNVALSSDEAFGYVVGGAFEIPEIKARVALTYNSEITHKLPTSETLFGLPLFGPSADTEITTPASLNIDFQTGLNSKTLLLGSVRYAKWSDLKIAPTGFDAAVNPGTTGDSISQLDDTIAVTVGIGRAITKNFSASVALGYETPGDDNLVSPLAPTNGNYSIAVGGKYSMDNVTISGGVRYTILGDSFPETGTPDVARANFSNNSVLALALKVGFSF